MIKYLFLTCCIALISSCADKSQMALEIAQFDKNAKVDTIWRHLSGSLLLVKIKDYGHMDEYRNQFLFLKKATDKNSVAYEIEGNDFDVRVLNNSLYLFIQNDHSYGWFYLQKRKVWPKLPQIDSIISEVENANKNSFVRNEEGIISIFEEGKLVNVLNYGDFILNCKLDFDTLKFGIYNVQNKNLIRLSNSSKRFLELSDGLYYVPYPGYNANKSYSLDMIFHVLDSMSLLQKRPDKIFIDNL